MYAVSDIQASCDICLSSFIVTNQHLWNANKTEQTNKKLDCTLFLFSAFCIVLLSYLLTLCAHKHAHSFSISNGKSHSVVDNIFSCVSFNGQIRGKILSNFAKSSSFSTQHFPPLLFASYNSSHQFMKMFTSWDYSSLLPLLLSPPQSLKFISRVAVHH